MKDPDARAADWESGAIAWVADRNHTPLIILRGVSDLVNTQGGESYANLPLFQKNARKIVENLAGQLPWWVKTLSLIIRRSITQLVAFLCHN